MSTAADPPASSTAVGLGYGIAIAVSIFILISGVMLASYACIKVKTSGSRSSRETDGGVNAARGGGGGNRSQNSVESTVLVLGLDRPSIESYPKIILGRSRRFPGPNDGACSICLSEYKENDRIRCIPVCNHCFHTDCVDQWLRMSATCPLCRSSPAPSPTPTPLATPLSELVPLAFHPR